MLDGAVVGASAGAAFTTGVMSIEGTVARQDERICHSNWHNLPAQFATVGAITGANT
jgi:hypothetical protein